MCDMKSFCVIKQKTAYEMRSSDWSSDVCSSDLLLHLGHIARAMEGDIAAGVDHPPRAVGERSLKRVHAKIIRHQKTVKADPTQDDVVDDDGRHAGATIRIDRGVDEMRRQHGRASG